MTHSPLADPYPEVEVDAPAPNPNRAVCKVERIPTSVFFIVNERDFPLLVKDAKQFCARCPEKEVCLKFALSLNLTDGIYGGRTASERGRMRRIEDKIRRRQWHWKRELESVDWDLVAYSIGFGPDWRSRLDPPEHMIDSDSVYFRTGDGMLGCRFKHNGCSARFETLEECFRHAHNPLVDHKRSDHIRKED